jgi:hypothetical protein
MTDLIVGTLTTAEWIVVAGSVLVFALTIAPIVWLTWHFVTLDDGTVTRMIDDVERLTALKEQARREVAARSS